jgi:beta-phosphoglucomutase family hydrolase
MAIQKFNYFFVPATIVKFFVHQFFLMKAVIFDMDGTVVDTTRIEYDAWKQMFDERQVDFPYDDYIGALGAKGSEIVKERIDTTDDEIEEMLAKKETYLKQLVEQNGLQLIPGVEKVMQEIQKLNLKMALATGSSQEKLDFIMERFHLRQYFDVFVTSDDVKNGKPDPEVFLKAASKMNVPPHECIVMEDASNGVEAAKSANMSCIAITSTRGKDQLEKADVVINHYRELSIEQFLLQQPKSV